MKKLLTQINQSFEDKKELTISHLETLAIVLASLVSTSDKHFFVITKDRAEYATLNVDLRTYFSLLGSVRDILIFPEILPPLSRFATESLGEVYAFLSELSKLSCPSLILLTSKDYKRFYPSPNALAEKRKVLAVKDEIKLQNLRQLLIDWGYDFEEQVEVFGEFACRGGIFDIFSPLYSRPFRLEFFGNEIESIREFDTLSQRSIKEVKKIEIIPHQMEDEVVSIGDYLEDGQIVVLDNDDQEIKVDINIRYSENTPNGNLLQAVAPLYTSSFQEIKMKYGQLQRKLLFSQLERWLKNQYELIIFCGHPSRVKRLKSMLNQETEFDISKITFDERLLNHGFIFDGNKTVVLSEDEVFGRLQVHDKERQEKEKKLISHIPFEELEAGQYAVHSTYGICYYHGIEVINSENEENECMILEFADNKKVFLPLSQVYLITRYKGGSKELPKLSSLSSHIWRKGRDKVIGAVKDVAAGLLRLQAARKSSQGYEFSEDNEWEQSFAQAFSFVETIDQHQAIVDVKYDMQQKQPMDRLLCGDVGFGKTEVAMRASFKAVVNSKQVAVIVPTTILSQQHFINFSKRMADYPVNIAILNRFIPLQKQREILEALMLGQIDIIIGTHRLVQSDIVFANLGLVVIDEEQKFGVEVKETLKRLKLSVDVLTMTATPIPRTLYHSLAGLRDLSTIATPPKERKAVKTIVASYDEEMIIKAVKYEVSRGGQIYFLHNRVGSIDKVCERLRLILPDTVRIHVGHGQMVKNHLEDVMNAFFEHKIDMLVCTTIIESGLDIPNANTIIVDRADKFGLSSLYQLRGRVGRDINQAYAYFFTPDESLMTTDAQKRLSAITRYTQLGAGLKLALRDLEIRGAGNLLGMEQSGHIAQVGFELYCQLLKQEVDCLKVGNNNFLHLLDIQLDFLTTSLKSSGKESACFPPSYIESVSVRIKFYKYLQQLDSTKQLDDFAEELRDRFGHFPQEVMNLLLYTRLKVGMLKNNYQMLRVHGKRIFLKDISNFVVKDKKTDGYYEIINGEAQTKLIQLISLVSKVDNNGGGN